MEDPLYEYILPKGETRQIVMELFFEIYLDIFGEYGDILTTSANMEAVAYLYYEERFTKPIKYRMSLVKGFIKSIDMLRYISIKDFICIINTVRGTSSAWIYKCIPGKYIHLDLIGVKKKYRGQGKGSHFIRYAIKKSNKYNLPLTLETQNAHNLSLYSKMGFKTIEEFNYKGLTQYCMLYRNSLKENEEVI